MDERDSMDEEYNSIESPRDMSDKEYRRLVEDVSEKIGEFSQLTRLIEQQMGLFNTPNDTRANHDKITKQVEKGKKLTSTISGKLKTLSSASTSGTRAQSRSRATQHRKLATDFKSQMTRFDHVCTEIVRSEQSSVNRIRNSLSQQETPLQTSYSEDQLYAQATVTSFHEDDVARREHDIFNITQQIKQVNTAYREIGDLVNQQDEIVVKVADDTEGAKEGTTNALQQVREADFKSKYCSCSKKKLCCYSIIIILVLILSLAIVLGLNSN